MDETTTNTVTDTSAASPVVVATPTPAPLQPIPEEKAFVVVVEDDKFLKELLVKKISKEGFDVQNAVDAESTFRILEERKADIVLCDLILPGIDGFEILKRIKEDPKTADIPVVILSNLGQKEDLDRATALGATDYMIKANFTLDEIVEKVRSIV